LPLPARAIQSFVLERAAFVAARSPRAAELIDSLGTAGTIGVTPHGVPSWPASSSPAAARPFTVGYAGRLVPEKGIGLLLDAVRRVAGARLLIVGDGPLLADVAAAEGIEIEVRTDVHHNDMARAFADMDVLALPSLTTPRWAEQFGRVLVEALWCGVPVVGSDSGEIPWVIETTGGGLTFSEGDVESFAAALTRMRDDPALRRRFAEEGRRVVEQRFSVGASARALDDLMRGVLHAA
jgi:glycosyltransferase involved in cell wall biosynthesis